MKNPESKVFLFHGENDYLIYKNLKEKKKELDEKKIEYKEFWGSDSLKFSTIYELLNSAPIFFDESYVILRNITDGRAFYDFVEDLQEYLKTAKSINNSLLIFNQGKVAKTTKIYKTIDKIGKIEEFTNPKEDEILDVIHKSLNISYEAAVELNRRTNGNLFLIRNEILKLKNILTDKKTKIEKEDIEELCVDLPNSNDVWNSGKSLIQLMIENSRIDNSSKKESSILNSQFSIMLLHEIDESLRMGTEPMMILYSFYNYVLNFIKMKKLAAIGKGFKETMSLGYYFAKDFFPLRDKIDIKKLFEVNSKLLQYEFDVKSGNVDEVLGLRKLILKL